MKRLVPLFCVLLAACGRESTDIPALNSSKSALTRPISTLTRDLRTDRETSGASLEACIHAGAKTFCTMWDELTGNELWITDGTKAGTRLVKDVVPGQD